MRNERGRLKAERDYNARNDAQQCIVCKRWFIKRAEKVCSRECAAKLASGPEGRR
jgi:hypothetical protein